MKNKITVLIILIVSAVSLNLLFFERIDWQASLASSKRFGPPLSAGETADLNNAKSYVAFAVLVQPGYGCRYFINGSEYALPSPTQLRTGTSKLSGRASSVRPDSKDLKNINIDGRTWDWTTTVQKDSSSNRSVVCDGDYFLTEKPGLAWYMVLINLLKYITYAGIILFVLYSFSRYIPKKS